MPYPNPPLVLTVCEIRFPELVRSMASDVRERIKAAVKSDLPLHETITDQVIDFTPEGPRATAQQLPRFTTRDRTSSMVVTRSTVSIETTAYDGYEGFRSLIELAVSSIVDNIEIDGLSRVGLRFIDEIRVPSIKDMPGNWTGYIDNHLLATVSDEFLAETNLTPQAWQGNVRYSTRTDSTLALRYGPQVGHATDPNGPTRRLNTKPPGVFFLLDSDSYWEARDSIPEFTVAEVMRHCDELHPHTRAVFDAVCTERLRHEVFGRG